MPADRLRFFLGGRDLEMEEIGRLIVEAGAGDRLVDHGHPWGARASAYGDEIAAALAAGETPVLVELDDDLPSEVDRSRLIVVDHHGSRAGADTPSSLRQVYELLVSDLGPNSERDPPGGPVSELRAPRLGWTRRRALIEANDVGHVAGMREVGASLDEIREIRDADRRAQGITLDIEAESRRAIATAEQEGELLVVRTNAPTSSAIADFILPEYGGPGATALVVAMPGRLAFFGPGRVIANLKHETGSWYGGALPDNGFWGAEGDSCRIQALLLRIRDLVRE